MAFCRRAGSSRRHCLGHPIYDVHAANCSIAKQALDRIGDLYGIEKIITGLPPKQR